VILTIAAGIILAVIILMNPGLFIKLIGFGLALAVVIFILFLFAMVVSSI